MGVVVELLIDTRKAGVWSILAGLALLARALLPVAEPQAVVLAVLGFGLLLPAIAVLHVRIGARLPQAGVLATLTGLATAVTGIVAAALAALEPGALFFLGLWWWTLGKFVAQSQGLLVRPFGAVTAAFGLLALAVGLLNALGAGRWSWDGPQVALGAWLLVLGALFWREARADEG